MGRGGKQVDWVRLLEAAYAPSSTHREWAEGVVDATEGLFERRDVTALLVLEHAADCSSATPMVAAGWSDFFFRTRAPEWAAHLSPQLIRELHYPPVKVTGHVALTRGFPPEAREMFRAARAEVGAVDALGLMLHPKPGVAGVVIAGTSAPVHLSRREERTLTQIALHLEAALRLRLRPEVLKAVITPQGRLVHQEPGAPPIEALARATRVVESARLRANRFGPTALDAWTALLQGRLSLVERREGSRRFYLVVENAPASQPMRALTAGEIDVLVHASRGLSSKLVAYALGISESRVSDRLRSAALKIGVATRAELVRIAAMLARDPRAGFEDIALTTAEHDVLELVAMGFTNHEIARIRNRSIRTIANQLATLLRKTGSATRRGLVTGAPAVSPGHERAPSTKAERMR